MSYKEQIMEEELEERNCLGCEHYCIEEFDGEEVVWCLYGSQCMYEEEYEDGY